MGAYDELLLRFDTEIPITTLQRLFIKFRVPGAREPTSIAGFLKWLEHEGRLSCTNVEVLKIVARVVQRKDLEDLVSEYETAQQRHTFALAVALAVAFAVFSAVVAWWCLQGVPFQKWGDLTIYPPAFVAIGRATQLEEIAFALQETGRVVLSGLGGIGKSHLLRAFLWAARKYGHYPGGVFEVHAEHERAFSMSLAAELNLVVDPSNDDYLHAAVRRWAAERPKWLIGVDNADDTLDMIAGAFCGVASGDIIVTTTGSPYVVESSSLLESPSSSILVIDRLGINDSLEFLCVASRNEFSLERTDCVASWPMVELKAATELATWSDGLPVVLGLAAGTAKEVFGGSYVAYNAAFHSASKNLAPPPASPLVSLDTWLASVKLAYLSDRLKTIGVTTITELRYAERHGALEFLPTMDACRLKDAIARDLSERRVRESVWQTWSFALSSLSSNALQFMEVASFQPHTIVVPHLVQMVRNELEGENCPPLWNLPVDAATEAARRSLLSPRGEPDLLTYYEMHGVVQAVIRSGLNDPLRVVQASVDAIALYLDTIQRSGSQSDLNYVVQWALTLIDTAKSLIPTESTALFDLHKLMCKSTKNVDHCYALLSMLLDSFGEALVLDDIETEREAAAILYAARCIFLNGDPQGDLTLSMVSSLFFAPLGLEEQGFKLCLLEAASARMGRPTDPVMSFICRSSGFGEWLDEGKANVRNDDDGGDTTLSFVAQIESKQLEASQSKPI